MVFVLVRVVCGISFGSCAVYALIRVRCMFWFVCGVCFSSFAVYVLLRLRCVR